MDWKRLNLPAGRLIVLAAAAGIVAGGLVVYVTSPPEGNGAEAALAESRCAAKAEAARRVGETATGEVAAMLAADPPRPLGDLSFSAPDGSPMRLADLAGKVVLMNLWATWCAPCRAEMPALDTLQREMGGEAFEVVAVNVDTGGDEKPRAFLSEVGIGSLAYYRDNTLGLFNELKKRSLALGLPVTLLIDGEGCLIAHMNGPAEWASQDARRLVETAIGQAGMATGS